MIRPPLGLGARLGALHAASFGGIGIYLPFFPIWLEHQALSPSMIGVILAIPIAMRIIVTTPIMSLVDRGIGPRRLLSGASLAVAAAYFTILFADSAFAIALLVALLAIAQAPIVPTSDLVTIDAIRRHPRLDYGRIRLWGSLAFLATSIGGGYLLGLLPIAAVIWFLMGLALATALIAQTAVPDAGAWNDRVREPVVSSWAVSFRPALRYALAGAACTQASHAALYGFASIHWRDAGFSSATIGWLWAVGVIAEILIFAAYGRSVSRGSAAFALLAIGSAAGVVRFVAFAANPGLGVTIALQLLHGLTFGVTHLGAMAALALLAPHGARGRAQGVMSAAQALAMAVATVLSGFLFREAGPLVFVAMAPLAGAGLVFALLAQRAFARQPQRAGEGG